MPATITYSARADQGIASLLTGGFTQNDITTLKENIELWVNNNYSNWQEDQQYFHADSDNHMRQQVNVYAQLTDKEEGEVEIMTIEAD